MNALGVAVVAGLLSFGVIVVTGPLAAVAVYSLTVAVIVTISLIVFRLALAPQGEKEGQSCKHNNAHYQLQGFSHQVMSSSVTAAPRTSIASLPFTSAAKT